MTDYVELQVTSNFSFLRGASHPEELTRAAAALGHKAIAITDRNTLAGVVRAHGGARQAGIRLVVGARLDFVQEPSVLCFPTDRAAYGRLSRLLTLGRRRAPKGECHLAHEDLIDHDAGQIVIALPPDRLGDADEGAAFAAALGRLRAVFPGRCYLAAQHLYRGDDGRRIAHLADLAEAARTPLVAVNDVHAHTPARRPLQDVLTCIRERRTLGQAGYRLFANGERHLKSGAEMARLFARFPEAVARTVEIAAASAFSLDELRYEYPAEPVPAGMTPQGRLVELAWAGAGERYGGAIPDKVRDQLNHELGLIGTLGYASYFLTVDDIVRFARGRGILCQGRGSAANSAVCYCLGITSVDPSRMDLLFERFVSAERNEPPDIDVDFEHERREEVIQYIYAKYGRERAGLTATVISYRARSAVREVGKALGLSLDAVDALAKTVWGWRSEGLDERHLAECGFDARDPTLRRALTLIGQLIGFPRHLSQHTGGFVITRGPLSEVVPIENAAMAERTVIQWDKDDIGALGILKVDVLGLGMLSCLRKGFELVTRHHGRPLELATVPAEDEKVYDMLCQGDSVGVFQVESRAQMTMLPRLKPRSFYDLVIEVAIVRPGPIQGDMVHPYLRRRNGEEAVDFPSPELEAVLGKTLGVPLFQEQAMKIAIVAAGFTPGEADGLRRAMATFRRNGTIHTFRAKLVEGMVSRGYERDFAERCFQQIEGFGEYGFPESHAASFALLVYVSAWLKRHYPAAFACALLNSQPMGFYAPAQIVRDACDHGVEVRPVDVNASHWDCTIEPGSGPGKAALRLGFRQVKGLKENDMARLVSARGNGYGSVAEVRRRAGLGPAVLERLAAADAWGTLGLGRREALWAVKGLGPEPLPLFASEEDEGVIEAPPILAAMAPGEQVIEDYAALRLSLKAHPLALLRPRFDGRHIRRAAELAEAPDGTRLTVAGLVICRQRPGTASGVIFMTLEDESGVANLIVWPRVFERYRRQVLRGRLLAASGVLRRQGVVTHLVARHIEDLSSVLGELGAGEAAMPISSPARADEVTSSAGADPREPGGRGAARGARPLARPAPSLAAAPERLFPSRDFH